MLLCLFSVEFFFQLNDEYKFVQQTVYRPKWNASTMTVQEAETQFGPGLYRVPPEYLVHSKKTDEKLLSAEPNHGQATPLYKLLSENVGPQSVRIEVRLMPPNDNVVVYDVEYKIDRYKRREVEHQQFKSKASRFVVSLGDSFTFGEGVTTGEDYPSQLAKKLNPEYHVYNFGKPGFGPNDLLFNLQTNLESFRDMTQNEGIAIWYFISAQLERTSCGFRCLLNRKNSFVLDKPKYELAGNKPVYVGKLSDTIPFSRAMMTLFAKSEALKFGINSFPVEFSKNDYRTFVAVLKEIKFNLEAAKNLRKFYFLITENIEHDPIFFELLNEAGIDVIDLSAVPKPAFKDSLIPYDWHPTAAYYWFITEILKKTVELN